MTSKFRKYFNQALNESNYDLKKKYNEFNKKYFKSKLPKISVKWKNLKNLGGQTYPKNNPIDVDYITINKNITDERQLDVILLHEMGHAYIYHQGIIPKRSHGKEFIEVAKMISKINPKIDISGTYLIVKNDIEGMDQFNYYFIFMHNRNINLKSVSKLLIVDYDYFKGIDTLKSTIKYQSFRDEITVYEVPMNSEYFLADTYKNMVDRIIDYQDLRYIQYQYRLIKKAKLKSI